MMRTLVLPACCRCRRPAYCCNVPRHDTGIASSNVSSGGWSNPSPNKRPVATTMRGVSGGQRLDRSKGPAALALAQAAMQHEQLAQLRCQCAGDRVDVVGSFAQHQQLAALLPSGHGFGHDLIGAMLIVRQMTHQLLNGQVAWQVCWQLMAAAHELQPLRGAGGLDSPVPDRAALHEQDRLQAVPAHRRGSQTKHIARFHLLQHSLKGTGGTVVAFVQNHLAIVLMLICCA